MSIFEVAMTMESEGRAYYLKHAENSSHPGLKRILLELADDELKHFNFFKELHEGNAALLEAKEATQIIQTVKAVFEEAATQVGTQTIADEARKIWAHALEVEKMAEELYRKKASECDDPKEQALLNAVADEEHQHWQVIHSVCEFLDSPERYIADAEWVKIENI